MAESGDPVLFEQYKLLVQSEEEISKRRAEANWQMAIPMLFGAIFIALLLIGVGVEEVPTQ